MVFGKGLRPLQVASIILFVRLLSVILVQTWYVPDEYWQSLEVAHKQVFGYGELTWEWSAGIRSYLLPAVISGLYWLLRTAGLDHPLAIIYGPRVLQALLSSYADYRFYVWSGHRKWALFLTLTSWFLFYTGSRTLLQSTETALVTIALSLYPFGGRTSYSYYQKESSAWMWLASLCVFIRPTSAPLWVVLAGNRLLQTTTGRLPLLGTYAAIALVTGSALVGLDSWCHGSLLVSPWEFFKANVLKGVASFYGTHPWHWYLWCGLPVALGPALLPAAAAAASCLRDPKAHPVSILLLTAAALHTALYSAIPHKEFRFVLPLVPPLLYVVQDVVVPWSRKANRWQLNALSLLLLLGNAIPALYFGIVHQAGTTAVMTTLRETTDNSSSVLFLMPCHSTPLYSHLHKNITTRYLHCLPSSAVAESEAFFHNPQRWWRAEYSTRQPPTHVVLFDVLRGRIENVLSGYRLAKELPHTQFPEGEVGQKVLVYQKVGGRSGADDAA